MDGQGAVFASLPIVFILQSMDVSVGSVIGGTWHTKKQIQYPGSFSNLLQNTFPLPSLPFCGHGILCNDKYTGDLVSCPQQLVALLDRCTALLLRNFSQSREGGHFASGSMIYSCGSLQPFLDKRSLEPIIMPSQTIKKGNRPPISNLVLYPLAVDYSTP